MTNSVRLCQFFDGPSIQLNETTQSTISAWELEDVLKSHLSSEIEIRTRTDPHLVDAVRPSVPIETVTGVWEDTLSNPKLQVTVWEAKATGEDTTNNTKCNCPEVHSEWTRFPLKQTKITSNEDTLQVKWVDVRNAHQLQLKTVAGCCHFLRNLLGTSHASMPWGDFDEEMPPVVALVVPPEAALTLQEFRTGDACPSYFLHSVSYMELPTSNPVWSEQANDGQTATSDAMLLIYKTIPPRDKTSLEYPLEKKSANETNLPDGCLWERFPKQHDDDEDEEIKNEHAIEEEEDARMLCPPYISYTQDYQGLLEPLLKNLSTLREEALTIPRWTAWPERQHYRSTSANGDDDVASWTVFPLCHCFPANVVENRKWIDVTCAYVPQTVALLKEKLGDTLRTALFSRLDPETTLEAHTGWQDLANHVIRVHIPLVVPVGGLCGTWVDGCVETHQEGRPLCFDDAKVHRAFNYSKQERIVLILDLARPSYLPSGHATGGHTDELDSFINSLT